MRYFPVFIVLFFLFGFLVACSSEPPAVAAEDLPTGDAGSGEKIFLQSINDAPSCASCHHLTDQKLVGPGLAGISERAGERVDGETAEEYLYLSITRPSRYLVDGYSNLMYPDFEEKLDPQDIADLIAFLLTQ